MSSESPNILLVTVDSLRADAVYGDDVTTPRLDELANESRVYKQAFAQAPFTTFSMPSLFTARYPSSLPYIEFSDNTVGVHIEDTTSLPEILQTAGYVTAGFHSNPLLSNLFGFDEGFDTFDARLPFSGFDVLSGRLKILADKALRMVRKHAYLPAEKLNERVVEWLDERPPDQPFFLWVHYMDVHGPYQSKSGNAYINKYRGESLWRKAVTRPEEITSEERRRLRDLYCEEVVYTDHYIGSLLDRLRETGEFEDTVCILTADHGEQFGEHASYSHPHQLYDELIHVPLLVSDVSDGTDECDSIVELIDLAPTLVNYAGADQPESFAGRSLSTRIESDSPAVSEANFVPEYIGAIRTDRWKYIRDGTDEELYDLHADPTEQDNLLENRAEVVTDLSARLDEHCEEHALSDDRSVQQQSIEDTELKDRLEDLGYLN